MAVGSEGTTPFEEYVNIDFTATHSVPDVDLVTIHIWPQNWGWGDASDGASFRAALGASLRYLEEHAGRAASLGITVDGLRLATLRGVGAERALLNGGVVQRARVSVDAVSIEMDGAVKAAGVLSERAATLRAAPRPADAPRAVALQARVEAAACGSLAAARLSAEVKVVDGAAEASLGDAEHGVLLRSTRGAVEVVSHDYVDDMAGTAAGRAVAALLAAAMEFAF